MVRRAQRPPHEQEVITIHQLHSLLHRENHQDELHEQQQRPPHEQEADEVDALLEKQRLSSRAVLDALDNEASATHFEIDKLNRLDAQLAHDDKTRNALLALDIQCLNLRAMFKPPTA